MPRDGMAIKFRPVVPDDLPLLSRWISSPHWQEWWGDVTTEIGYIKDMLEGRDSTQPFIFQVGGIDAGYIQMWIPADQLFEPWLSEAPWLKLLPDGAVGVDISIANTGDLSRGIGSKVLSSFVEDLRAKGLKEIYIDPDPKNKRAVRAYEKAGFRAVPSMIGKTGDYLIMRHEEKIIADTRSFG